MINLSKTVTGYVTIQLETKTTFFCVLSCSFHPGRTYLHKRSWMRCFTVNNPRFDQNNLLVNCHNIDYVRLPAGRQFRYSFTLTQSPYAGLFGNFNISPLVLHITNGSNPCAPVITVLDYKTRRESRNEMCLSKWVTDIWALQISDSNTLS